MRISDWSSDVCSSDLRCGQAADAVDGTSNAVDRVRVAVAGFSWGGVADSPPQCSQGHRSAIAEPALGATGGSRVSARHCQDRKSVGSGKSVSVRVDLGVSRNIKKKNTTLTTKS